MPPAVKIASGLGAPTVGTWWPALGPGRELGEGDRIGTLVQVGRRIEVRVPEGVSGRVATVRSPGSWVQYGASLVEWGASAPLAEADDAPSGADEAVPEGLLSVRADSDGTAHLRPEPGSRPFVEPGAVVARRDTLALIEVMKTFTPCLAPVAGTVRQVRVADGEAVQAGRALFWLEPTRG